MDSALIQVCEEYDGSDLNFIVPVHYSDFRISNMNNIKNGYTICFWKTYSDSTLKKYLRITVLKRVDCYSKYFTPNRGIKYGDIECQWKSCNKMKRSSNVNEWKKCKGCQMARYCSKSHQKKDWSRGQHKYICKLFH